MKPSHMLRTAFFATVASAALSTAAFAQIQPMQYNGITYVTGGIGLSSLLGVVLWKSFKMV